MFKLFMLIPVLDQSRRVFHYSSTFQNKSPFLNSTNQVKETKLEVMFTHPTVELWWSGLL